MAQYGVWLEQADEGPGIGTRLEAGEAPPGEPASKAIQFVWRGSADDRDGALRAAHAEWELQYGPKAPGGVCYVEEILPGDAGYQRD